jgi:hypothetical protein
MIVPDNRPDTQECRSGQRAIFKKSALVSRPPQGPEFATNWNEVPVSGIEQQRDGLF